MWKNTEGIYTFLLKEVEKIGNLGQNIYPWENRCSMIGYDVGLSLIFAWRSQDDVIFWLSTPTAHAASNCWHVLSWALSLFPKDLNQFFCLHNWRIYVADMTTLPIFLVSDYSSENERKTTLSVLMTSNITTDRAISTRQNMQ